MPPSYKDVGIVDGNLVRGCMSGEVAGWLTGIIVVGTSCSYYRPSDGTATPNLTSSSCCVWPQATFYCQRRSSRKRSCLKGPPDLRGPLRQAIELITDAPRSQTVMSSRIASSWH